jgi:hypothetical protein
VEPADACHCLLCRPDLDPTPWDARDQRIAGHVREHGWTVMGVAGDDRTPGWAYTIGLWHTLRSPEVAVFGLPTAVGMRAVNVLGAQIRDGAPIRPDERRADVLEDYDVVLRQVRPQWYRQFFGAGLDFYRVPPLPFAQLCWPDRRGRFGWEPDAEATCRTHQPMLWLSRDEHPDGFWADLDPYHGWPFGTSLPYIDVHTSSAVAAGTASISTVVRDHGGSWQFLDADGAADAVTQLRQIANDHPYVLAVADLAPGHRAARDATGAWSRSPLP